MYVMPLDATLRRDFKFTTMNNKNMKTVRIYKTEAVLVPLLGNELSYGSHKPHFTWISGRMLPFFYKIICHAKRKKFIYHDMDRNKIDNFHFQHLSVCCIFKEWKEDIFLSLKYYM